MELNITKKISSMPLTTEYQNQITQTEKAGTNNIVPDQTGRPLAKAVLYEKK